MEHTITIREQYELDQRIVTQHIHPHSINQTSVPVAPIQRPRIGSDTAIVDAAVRDCISAIV